MGGRGYQRGSTSFSPGKIDCECQRNGEITLKLFGFIQSELGLEGPRQMALRAKLVWSFSLIFMPLYVCQCVCVYLSLSLFLSHTHTCSFNSRYWHPFPLPHPRIRNHRGPLYFLLTHLARC